MQILFERPGDQPAIRAVTLAAFTGHPHSQQTEAVIVDALRRAGALAVSLVAVEGGELVGHIAFSPVTIDGSNSGWFGLGPVSVTPQHQGRGIGSRLISDGLAHLKAQGANGCVVVGDPGYYRRFGFRPEAGLTYADAPAAYFQALPFNEGAAIGQVAYHAGFSASQTAPG